MLHSISVHKTSFVRLFEDRFLYQNRSNKNKPRSCARERVRNPLYDIGTCQEENSAKVPRRCRLKLKLIFSQDVVARSPIRHPFSSLAFSDLRKTCCRMSRCSFTGVRRP